MWEEIDTSQFSRIKQRPATTPLSGTEASVNSSGSQRNRLAVAYVADFHWAGFF